MRRGHDRPRWDSGNRIQIARVGCKDRSVVNRKRCANNEDYCGQMQVTRVRLPCQKGFRQAGICFHTTYQSQTDRKSRLGFLTTITSAIGSRKRLLKPVTFRYKKELDPKGAPQFGLVGGEVAKVNRAARVSDSANCCESKLCPISVFKNHTVRPAHRSSFSVLCMADTHLTYPAYREVCVLCQLFHVGKEAS